MLETLRLRLDNAKTLLRRGGFPALVEAGRTRFLLTLSANKQYVSIDGCTFDIREIRDEFMRLLILTNEYEKTEREATARYIRPDIPVVELGGCIGVVSCIANKRLRDPRAHVVVEANPLVVPQLQRNRDLNSCQFKIVNCAISYGADTVTFSPNSSFVGNSMHATGDLPPVTVQAVRLSDLVRENGFETFALLCDIEGSECAMIENDADALKRAEVIVMEMHPALMDAARVDKAANRLSELGFELAQKTSLANDSVFIGVWVNRALKLG